MTFAVALVYLVLSTLLAEAVSQYLTRRFTLGGGGCAVRSWSIWTLALAIVFFGPFYLIGYVALAGMAARISLSSLFLVQFCLLLLFVPFILSMKIADMKAAIGGIAAGARMSAVSWRAAGMTWMAGGSFLLLALVLMGGFPRGDEVAAYHLPIAVHIFQSGTLSIWDNAYMHTFPANMSIIAGFFLNAFPERLTAILSLPFLGMGACLVYVLACRAGSDRSAALLSAAGFATLPMIAFSSLEVGADVAGIAFLLLAFVLFFDERIAFLPRVLMAGLAFGLAFGFKSIHLIGGAAFGCIILWRAVQLADRGKRGRDAVVAGLTFSTGFVLTAGFWLVRNYVELGNPLYPVHFGGLFDLVGWTKAADVDYALRDFTQDEWVRSSAEWLVYPWVEWHFIGQNFKHSSGLGPYFATLVPVSLVCAGLLLVGFFQGALRAGNGFNRFLVGSLLFTIFFCTLLWWLLHDHQPRYLLGAIALSIPLSACLISIFGGRLRSMMEILAAACIGVMLVIVVSRQTVEFADRVLRSGQKTRALYYEYVAAVDHLPAGSVIANLSERRINYSLFGERFRNRVISGHRFLTVLDEEKATGQGRDAGPAEAFSRTIRRLGVTHAYTVGGSVLDDYPCARRAVIGRIDRNPVNGVALDQPRILYSVGTCR